jgi:dienelactone hydrolase
VTTEWSRRRVLALLGSSGATALAGCLDDGGNGDETPTADDQTRTETTTPNATDTATQGATPTATQTDSASGQLSFEHHRAVQFDEPFGMTIRGLPSETTAEVTVEASAGEQSYTVTTTVETDDGTIDLADATVVDGAVPPGLDVPTTGALLQFAEPPEGYLAEATESTLTVRVDPDGGSTGLTSLRRDHPDFVAFERPRKTDLVGGLFTPPEGERGPGVIFLHGSQAQPGLLQAALLAQHGFTAFAPLYYGRPGLPESLLEVPVEYVQQAAEWLLDHELVVGDRVGLAGASRGGELALLAGSQFDSIGPVVSISGSGVVWEGFDQELRFANESSWTIDGDPVSYIDVVAETQSYPTAFARATDDQIEAATIPVENIDGPILFVSGGDDQLWPARRLQEISTARLEANGRENFEHLVYEGAGHTILPRYLPVEGSLYINGISRGGTLAANAEASHDHWPHVIETLSALKE